jgi:AraC family transcriptional regulator
VAAVGREFGLRHLCFLGKRIRRMKRDLSSSWWILHERARHHHWRGEGALSIKTFTGGRALYSVGRGKHAVGDDCYLILNQNQTYEILIDSRKPVESFCIFFPPGYVEAGWTHRSSTEGKLLDDPFGSGEPLRFFETVAPQTNLLSRHLRRIRQSHRGAERLWMEEQLRSLTEELVVERNEHLKQVKRINCVRASTREEIFRRVSRARDYADAMFAEDVTLADLATAAALSPNHLLRTFREVFHQTPCEYLRERRLKEAARLLASGQVSVTETCLAVGFESVGSFSSAFKRHTGISPADYRASKR